MNRRLVSSVDIQLSTVLVYFLAAWIRRKWAWIVADLGHPDGVEPCLSGRALCSRRGGGILLGALTLGGYAILMRYLLTDFAIGSWASSLVVIFAPLLFAILYVVMVLIQGDLNTSVPGQIFWN